MVRFNVLISTVIILFYSSLGFGKGKVGSIQKAKPGKIIQSYEDSEDIFLGEYVSYRFKNSAIKKIYHENASFIKLNFKLSLLQGDYVTVCNPNKTECYRYPDGDGFTYDEDGSIWSLSLEGDTAELEIHNINQINSKGIDFDSIGVELIQYQRGLSKGELLRKLPPSTVCGKKDFVDIECVKNSESKKYEMHTGVARLRMGRGSCTAWLVKSKNGKNNLLMTNNHCMADNSKVARSESQFMYQAGKCNGNAGSFVKVSGKTMLKTNKGLDYTLYEVNDSNKLANFKAYSIDSGKVSIGDKIYIIQHPRANPKKIAIKDDKSTGNLCQVNRFRGKDHGYYCDTEPGSSGSPVFKSSNHKIIAIHHYGGCHNSGVKMELIKPEISKWISD